MKIIAVIPARYASTRFPGKPLALIAGKPMIQRVFENVSEVEKISAVYVATDDPKIYNCVENFGGNVLMTSPNHTCGTDRLAECVEILKLNEDDVILNIQGDEPLIRKEMINDLMSTFEDSDVYMGTLKKKIDNEEEIANPNVVKVITDIRNDAIYFSRYPVPYERDGIRREHYKHIGVYGYRVWFIKEYSKMEKTQLELSESLEQLRVIENGYKIRVKETMYQTVGVDTPEQIEQVERIILKVGL
jgi:3-deoxy-manno-octulosonate cytidylyltransferase (CMP-KDO synthetase)